MQISRRQAGADSIKQINPNVKMMRVDYGVTQSKDSALRMSGHNIVGGGGIGVGMNN